MAEAGWYLYRLEARLNDGRLVTVVVAAANEEKAFQYAESHLERDLVFRSRVAELSLVEKKSLHPGVGYAVVTAEV
ncbi:MAG: DUF3906 family protein [Calditerricola sp.]|nr:DUF3906 family protein [Calditerricola sp.]